MPSPVLGTMSPYPTVVIVTSAHQMESGMLMKSLVGLSRILKMRCEIVLKNVHLFPLSVVDEGGEYD